jgi:hypothetical protein
VANYSKFSPDFQGRRRFIMKIIFSSISRLFFAYSKFILMVMMLSTLGTIVHSSEATYLECDDKYYRLTGTYFETNYNIRTKKFKNKYKLYSYGVDFISIQYNGKINRNTGEWKNSDGKKVCILNKINLDELPTLNQEGKLF